jgi:hypothetical protein
VRHFDLQRLLQRHCSFHARSLQRRRRKGSSRRGRDLLVRGPLSKIKRPAEPQKHVYIFSSGSVARRSGQSDANRKLSLGKHVKFQDESWFHDRNEGEALEAASPLWPMQLPLPDFLTDIGIYTSLQRIRCRNPWQSTAVDLVSFRAQGSSGYPRCMGTANLY